MRTFTPALLLTIAILSAYWAYAVIGELINIYSKNITSFDLIVIFVLGLIAGIALCTAGVLRWKPE